MGSSPKPKVLHVVGARPNFIKIAPILREMDSRGGTENVLLHTGQHYDSDMSESFFEGLGIRPPDINLGVGSGTHGHQTAEVLKKTEDVLREGSWGLVDVVGDVNSTLAAALAAAKLGVPVAHVEAGLRSGDRRMPEEINRILTDQLSDHCLTPSRDADENLVGEGIPRSRITFVGNVMIDTLLRAWESNRTNPLPFEDLEDRKYVVVTLHRPSNVDDREQLREIIDAIEEIARRVPVVFPVHPRTANALERFGIQLEHIRVLPPIGYNEMLTLQGRAGLMMTDSGGIQEETTVLGVPCLTLRSSTERPVTIEEGTNRLVPERTTRAILDAFDAAWGIDTDGRRPEGWDGKTASRIADVFHEALGID